MFAQNAHTAKTYINWKKKNGIQLQNVVDDGYKFSDNTEKQWIIKQVWTFGIQL